LSGDVGMLTTTPMMIGNGRASGRSLTATGVLGVVAVRSRELGS
jgi:hypothetical protein